MKIFGTKLEETDALDLQTVAESIRIVEETIRELRQSIIRQRAILKNADKKLQEFTDIIAAIKIEDEHVKRGGHLSNESMESVRSIGDEYDE